MDDFPYKSIALLSSITILLLVLSFGIKSAPKPRLSQAEINNSQNTPFFNESKSGLINDFPDNIPLYPNFNISRSYITNGSRTVYSVELISDEPITEVMDWYINSLESDGWEIVIAPEDKMTVEKFLKAVREDGEIYLTVEYTDERRKTEIIIEYIPD